MASYKLSLKPSVEKDLRSVRKEFVPRIWARIAALADDPFPKNIVKLTSSEQLYRIRVGDYRVIYRRITDDRGPRAVQYRPGLEPS